MDLFTQAVWDVITENDELLEELTAIIRQEHKPFLNQEQAFTANTHILKSHLLAKLTKWLEWLPALPIDQIGYALAEEAIEFVEWGSIAHQLSERILRTTHAAVKLSNPSATVYEEPCTKWKTNRLRLFICMSFGRVRNVPPSFLLLFPFS